MFWRTTLSPILTLVGAPLNLHDPEGDLFVPLEASQDFDFLIELSRFVARKRLPIRIWRIYLGPTQNWTRRVQTLMALSQSCTNLEVYCLAEEMDRLHRLLARHRVQITIHAWTSTAADSRSAV